MDDKSKLTKAEACAIAEHLHNSLLMLHGEMVTLAGHRALANPQRIGALLDELVGTYSVQLVNYFGKPALHSDDLGIFTYHASDDDEEEEEPNELN